MFYSIWLTDSIITAQLLEQMLMDYIMAIHYVFIANTF